MKGIKIVFLKKIDSSLLTSINKLIPQLDKELKEITKKDLSQMVRQRQIKIITAVPKNNPNQIIGILFFVYFHTLAGKRGRIEDLVVDKNYRGMGIGKTLVRRALTLAKKYKLQVIELTSRPQRVIANKLYQKIGFVKKQTNVYQYKLNKN